MRLLPVVLACLVALLLAVTSVRVGGDGGEYTLSARALAVRGAPDLREEDAMWLSKLEPRWKKLATRIAGGMQLNELTPLSSVRRAPNGRYYSLHFWFYSLLAVPFLWLTEHFHQRPALALAVVNGLAACGALCFLFRCFGTGRTALVVSILFMLAGTTFYIGWTGPEVLTACGALVACLAGRRGELGLAVFAAGVAAAQNPTAAFLLPYVFWLRSRRRMRLTHWDKRFIGAGVFLTVLPYAFFYYEFHYVSLILHFATDFSLISGERAWSLLFDLNQGVLVGIPGVLLGTLAALTMALATALPSERLAVLTTAAAALLVVVCMAVPTFAIHNWNSGSVVFIRYGYWLAMPLFELALELGLRLSAVLRSSLAAATAVLQLGVLALNGLVGENYVYLRASRIAEFVLERWPSAYNPVPEIFYERALGWEPPLTRFKVVVWPREGTPRKILARRDHSVRSDRVCPDGETVMSARRHAASDGWDYLDAPFGCKAQ